jgi:hypothetical protein
MNRGKLNAFKLLRSWQSTCFLARARNRLPCCPTAVISQIFVIVGYRSTTRLANARCAQRASRLSANPSCLRMFPNCASNYRCYKYALQRLRKTIPNVMLDYNMYQVHAYSYLGVCARVLLVTAGGEPAAIFGAVIHGLVHMSDSCHRGICDSGLESPERRNSAPLRIDCSCSLPCVSKAVSYPHNAD